MTTASELAVPAPRSALYYIVGAFRAPRIRVGELAEEPGLKSLAWRIVVLSALVSAGFSIASGFIEPDAETTFLAPDYATADKLISVAIDFAFFAVSFPIAIFLWRYLFGYRDQTRGIWAASAMAVCPAVIISLLLEIAYLVAGKDELIAAGAMTVAYFLIGAMLVAVYYSAALAISYVRAVTLSIANMMIHLISVIAMAFAVLFLSFLFSAPVTP